MATLQYVVTLKKEKKRIFFWTTEIYWEQSRELPTLFEKLYERKTYYSYQKVARIFKGEKVVAKREILYIMRLENKNFWPIKEKLKGVVTILNL